MTMAEELSLDNVPAELADSEEEDDVEESSASVSGPSSSSSSLSSSSFRLPLPTNNSSSGAAMGPRPYDDGLFIEPAGDYDVVYGDYNATMGDGTPSGKRPYIRLTSALHNMSRPVGAEVRMRCEAAGAPLPIQFTWLKNLAPVEKNRRTRIRHRDMSSKLVIVELDVLDSGYYQCTATNAAGSVNSTAVLRVSPSSSPPSSSSSSSSSLGNKRPIIGGGGGRVSHSRIHHRRPADPNADTDYDTAQYDNNYLDEEEMKSPGDPNDVWRVPNTAGGPGYAPMRHAGDAGDGRWLDGQAVHKGDCIAYRGEACAQYLAGKHVKVQADREQIYDAEKDLLAAMMTVRVMPGVSEKCRQLSHQVACYHMFKVCDTGLLSSSSAASSSAGIVSLCREDCDQLKSQVCPNEFSMAAQHDLVGDAPKALLPKCDALVSGAPTCLKVLEKQQPSPALPPNLLDPSSSSSSPSHWCFVGAGTKYQGTASTTRSNRPCIYWPNTSNSEFNTDAHPQLRNAKNHCRNPSRHSQFQEPWCYTVSPGNSLFAEPCNVPRCPPNLYPELDDSSPLSPSHPSSPSSGDDSPFSSLATLWQSLSAQSQVLALSSGLGALAFLLILLALCCFCCRRGKNGGGRGRRRHKGMTHQGPQQQESASSMLSGSVAATQPMQTQQKLGMMQNGHIGVQHHPQPPQHHPQMLVQSCNGGSTITNSDLNSAFYRKVRDERMRAAVTLTTSDEMLNPLLPPSYGGGGGTMDHFGHPQQQQQQQQLFEMKLSQQQLNNNHGQQPYRFWESNGAVGSGTLNSASAANGYPPYYMVAPQSQQPSYGSPHPSAEAPMVGEPYQQIAGIQEHQLQLSDRLIGEDASTQLILGEWVGGMISGATLKVAIKALKPNMPHIAAEQFREEILAIGHFEHPNVVRLFGFSFLHGHLCAVFDYMVHGDLVEFLKVREPRGGTENDEQERARNAEDFLRIGTQITAGMHYLASRAHVHRDLAARNCLVGDQQVIKLADFARMKPQYAGDYYKLNSNARGVPLRWLAKEVLNEGKYSEASDVYAFGVCLWEIYTYARQPFEQYMDEEVIRLIQEDNYPEMPEYCPPAVYAQMVECFNANPMRRPNFGELHSKFQKWCSSGQPSALQMQQHRAGSVHSGGSSSGVNCGGPLLMNGGGAARMLRQTHAHAPGGASVPSPAPNANSTTILAGNLSGNASGGGGKTAAQMAKLALLSNGGAAIVHSTPIGQNSSDDGSQSKRPIPPARRRQPPAHNRVAYTEDEDDDEEEEVSYSSDESRDS